ncbi:MAG: GNAT family N-acetyltransferase [Candidatus Aenigmatarchaeota archaeon]
MEKHSKIQFLGKKSPSKLYPIIGLKGKKPMCVYPIFYYALPFVRYVFSPPLGTAATYQGPLIADYNTLKQSKKESYFVDFQSAVDKFMSSQLKVNFTKLRLPPNFIDSRPLMWNGYSTRPLYDYVIDLTRKLSEIFDSFSKSRRRNIRNTEESEFVFSEGAIKELDLTFESVSDRYYSQGIDPEITLAYLHDTYDVLHPANLRIFSVNDGETFLTGSIFLFYKEKAQAWIGSPKTDHRGNYPNDLLLWKCIQWAKNSGYKKFEITWANTYRLCKYKAKYNPELSQYFSCEKCSPFINFMRSIKNKIQKDQRDIFQK